MNEQLSTALKEQVFEILKEETEQFLAFHRHLPIGREAEDVIDNAFSRLQWAKQSVPYTQVSNLYSEMMAATQRKV